MQKVSDDYRRLLQGKFCDKCRTSLATCEHHKENFSSVQKKIPNHMINTTLDNMLPFYNYNSTQLGYFHANEYAVQHWATTMFAVNIHTKEIIHFELPFISMTSSILVGRILRSKLVQLDRLREYVLGGGSSITPLEGKELKKWIRYINKREEHELWRV